MKRADLGRWAEDLLCKLFEYERVPGSGSQWPHKEDLVKRDYHNNKFIAQVKATEGLEFLKGYMDLVKYARAEKAGHQWFQVVKTPNGAYIFEVTLVRAVSTGLGGDV